MFDESRHQFAHRESFRSYVYSAVAGLKRLPLGALRLLARCKGAQSSTRASTTDSALDLDENCPATRLALVDAHIGTSFGYST